MCWEGESQEISRKKEESQEVGSRQMQQAVRQKEAGAEGPGVVSAGSAGNQVSPGRRADGSGQVRGRGSRRGASERMARKWCGDQVSQWQEG